MMKYLFLLLLLAPLYSTAQSTKIGFKITGTLEAVADNSSIKLYKNGGNEPITEGKYSNKSFLLTGAVSEPVLCMLVVGEEKPIEIYVENKPISLSGSMANPAEIKVLGSSTHDEFKAFTKLFLPLAKQLNENASAINSLKPGEDRTSLTIKYEKTKEQILEEISKWHSKNLNSIVTAFILRATYGFTDDIVLLEQRFNQLGTTVRRSEEGKALEEFINFTSVGAIGTKALEFTQADPDGKQVSLSSFRGKYVLIDFWASWCKPCRDENPNVVANYKKFKNKNFTVLGVSLDKQNQKDKWLAAIESDQLTWTHVSDLKFWDNAVAKLYKVQGIPQNFLIDPSGKIVAKNLRGPELEAKLCEIIGCTN